MTARALVQGTVRPEASGRPLPRSRPKAVIQLVPDDERLIYAYAVGPRVRLTPELARRLSRTMDLVAER